MSATNRGSKRKEQDAYSTPIETILSFLEYYSIKKFNNILEPASGENSITNILFQKKNAEAKIWTNDIRVETLAQYNYNFVTEYDMLIHKMDVTPDLIITNPPFSYTMEFILAGLACLQDNGDLVILQRVNYLGSNKRFSFWGEEKHLREIYVLHKRPNFIGKSTDATEYAWFVFDKRKHDYAKLRVI